MKLIFTYIVISFSIVASNTIEKFFNHTKKSEFSLAYETAINTTNHSVKKQLIHYYNIIYDNNLNEDGIFGVHYEDESLEKNLNLINKGLIHYLKRENEVEAISTFKEAYLLAIKRNDKVLAAESLKLILEIYQRFLTFTSDFSYEPILNEYSEVTYDDFEQRNYLLKKIKLSYDLHDDSDEITIRLFKTHRIELESFSTDSKLLNARIQLLESTINSNIKKDQIKSRKLILEAANSIASIEQGIFEKERLVGARINLAINTYKQKDYTTSIKLLNQIELNDENYMMKLMKSYKFYWLSKAHKKLKNELISLKYYNQYLELFSLYNQSSKANENAELRTKYQTEKKEKQILLEQQKKKQNRNIAYSLGGLLFFGSITFLLIQKNTKRKQLLAEQEKELQVQKVGTLMKEQELASIDAMIEGQEKERQRIANDLHDDLGGMMATVKLHFNTLKDKPSADLYNKTDKLLDEAYQKVRSIAHAKNSGVIAKHGLLKSVNNMAQKVSSTGKIKIDVIDHGLEDRLENSLELTIFRIIQELITNVIKHANASEATIHLTQHDDSLNIMVEDNGKGFNPKNIKKDQGMGISSIDKRVDYLNGSLEIESEKGQGTTIIIDIPI